ncbi:riboflavin synthase [bacterium]|nr:riboflavin synthase [bacterium]
MFTGIIEEIGRLISVDSISGGKRLKISGSKIFDDLKIDDSVCVSGVCLTVTKIDNNFFWCDAVGETLNKTTFANVNQNCELNLERALRLSDRFGGHLVLGHINGIGVITQLTKLGENFSLEIEIPKENVKYVADEGSITIDGIGLTVAHIVDRKITISIIPHTWNNTNLKKRKTGDRVNIETDIFAKYVEKILISSKDDRSKLTDNWFKNLGY